MSDYSYKDQWEVLKRISLKEGEYLRIQCPFCHGRGHTFGIRKENGVISWGCFRASCKVHGKKDYGQSLNLLRSKMTMAANKWRPKLIDNITNTLVNITGRDSILVYLASVHSLAAHGMGLTNIQYSPIEDRIMFPVVYEGKTTGYAGRSLKPNDNNKWQKYGDTSHLFTCGNGPLGVLVEDAPSACAVGIIKEVTGISLLGTTITTQHKLELIKYSRIIICLDPDAQLVGLQMVKQLSGITEARLRYPRDDLKYFSPEQIKDMIGLRGEYNDLQKHTSTGIEGN